MMKTMRIFIFTISFLFLCGTVFSQDQTPSDSIEYPEQFGVRVGVDLSKPIRSLIDDNYRGFEVLGDYRVYKDYYLAVEFGNERFLFDEPNLQVESSGTYFKIGANYNAYENWLDMQNSIYVGIRYGFATFSETMESYAIYTGSDYFEPDLRIVNQEFSGLTASWIEFQAGIKAEILHNVYLGIHVELKRRLSQKSPPQIDNVYIPGFNRTYDRSKFGAGWGYSISYMIPIYSKQKARKKREK